MLSPSDVSLFHIRRDYIHKEYYGRDCSKGVWVSDENFSFICAIKPLTKLSIIFFRLTALLTVHK